MNFKRLWLEWSVLIFQLITNRGKETKEPSESVCKQILNTPLLRLRNKTHWNQTLYPYQSRHYRCNNFLLRKGSTPQPNGLGQRKDGVATLIRSRSHLHSALTWKVWSYYQSMGSEFRYDFKKVLGTQNRPTSGSASTYHVLRLNLNKDIFNIAFFTHTRTKIHLTIDMASIIPKP